MIADLDLGGVLVPGLLVLALLALAATLALLRLLAAVRLRHLPAGRALVELSLFTLIFCLLVHTLPLDGIRS